MKMEDTCRSIGVRSRNAMFEIMQFIPDDLKSVLVKALLHENIEIEEIRMRAGKPIMLHNYNGDWFVSSDGCFTERVLNSCIVTQEHLVKTLSLMSENSIYAYQDEIKNGYITLKGGHRVGISGRTVMDGSNVKNIKDISGLNIRISKEIYGCSHKIIKYISDSKGGIYNTLIISPPQCGKTTILRDIARCLSDGYEEAGIKGMKVGIVDERSELAGCCKGIPQYRVGVRTDVLDGCPKSVGMIMMLRAMSPHVIVTDEIGGTGDKEAVLQVINAGIKIITSAHGYNISELKTRREVLSLLDENVFERFIVLSGSKGPGTVEEVIDGVSMKALMC